MQNTLPALLFFGPQKLFMVKLSAASAVGSFNETIKTAYALNWQTHLYDRAEKSLGSAGWYLYILGGCGK